LIKIKEGKKFYAKRKSTVKPVFGIMKEIMGFHHFMPHGNQEVQSTIKESELLIYLVSKLRSPRRYD
jgi:hypothetical protein